MSIEVDITKRIKDFSLRVQFSGDHMRMGLLGASGCGKSMTLKCIAGVERPDKGRIVLDDQVLFDSEKKINLPPQQRKIGYLFQNYALFPTMTVEQNLACVLSGKKAEKEQRVREQIVQYQLQGLEKHLPGELSGGQQQRVALARMMLAQPKMIMLDEPFSAMDGYLKDTLQRELLVWLADFPGEVVMVSHSRDEIYKFCPVLTVIQEGHSIYSGKTKEVFENPVYREVAKLTGCKNIAEVQRMDAHTVFVKDWNMQLHFTREIEEHVRYVGVRAHRLLAGGGDCPNQSEMTITGYVDTPFEHQYLLQKQGAEGQIWWLVAKNIEKDSRPIGAQEIFGFPESDLMLLQE
ncbi:MAG: ATP-binding cassette domain-containing protein [Lachnospiraceae bacterium]|nr:ATP-binding cassette domain-containing protein [Lachnospiraceae bacterium]